MLDRHPSPVRAYFCEQSYSPTAGGGPVMVGKQHCVSSLNFILVKRGADCNQNYGWHIFFLRLAAIAPRKATAAYDETARVWCKTLITKQQR